MGSVEGRRRMRAASASSGDEELTCAAQALSLLSSADDETPAQRAARTLPDLDHPVRERIGGGPVSQVHRAHSKLYGTTVAIKTWSKRHITAQDLALARTECNLLPTLRHPNIAQALHEIETDDTLRLVMCYYGGGDLLTYVTRRRRLDEAEARAIFLHLLAALRYAHERGVAHLDVKLENIFRQVSDYDAQHFICLGDWNFALPFVRGKKVCVSRGTLAYAAPELLTGQPYEPPTADYWSAAVVLHTMLLGTTPFHGRTLRETQLSVIGGLRNRTALDGHAISPHGVDLLLAMLCADTAQRLCAIEPILAHAWFSQQQ